MIVDDHGHGRRRRMLACIMRVLRTKNDADESYHAYDGEDAINVPSPMLRVSSAICRAVSPILIIIMMMVVVIMMPILRTVMLMIHMMMLTLHMRTVMPMPILRVN